MSYDIELCDPVTKEVLTLDAPHDMRGGTYAIGGTTEAWLNITYNYGKFYREHCPTEGLRSIYGMTGAESIPYLQSMIATIQRNHPDCETSPDYWAAVPGNAIKPLHQLIALARLRPDGVWKGD